MVQFGCQSITQKGCFPYDHDDSLCDLQHDDKSYPCDFIRYSGDHTL